MISILIPIYNWDSTTLINSLVKQGNSINVQYEIIAIDDFSNSKHDISNFSMNKYDFVEVFRNEKNLGRSRTRNTLAEKANFNWLLFIDADSYIEDDFLKNYILEIKNNQADVICGGTIYSETPPSKKELMLHWNYGTKREAKTAEQRNKAGFTSFTSNNFAIKSLNFSLNQFDESITEYGHEDTLLGKQLEKSKVKITHINNPVKHLGIETNDVFMKKSEKAIDNVIKLYKEGKITGDDVRLLNEALTKKTVLNLFGKYTKNFAKNRALNKGCLVWFDVWRLILLTEKMK
ncbi:MAG: glycosyltransferase family 2 protein [Ichthyobacteriaceae bacterium]|nr:glycosyltransferase family 2 protein [Ichthyobacteriaceae bacterium]